MPEEQMEEAPKPAAAPTATAGGSVENEKALAAGAYLLGIVISFILGPLGFLGPIITYFVGKNSKLVRFHSIQSLLLTIVLAILSTLVGIAFVAMTVARLGVAVILAPLLLLLGLVFFVYYLYLADKAYKGEFIEVPVLGKFAMQYSEKSFID